MSKTKSIKKDINIEDINKDIMKLRQKLEIVNQVVFELEEKVFQIILLKNISDNVIKNKKKRGQ